VAVPAPPRGRASIGCDLGGSGADLQKKAALVGRLSGAQILHFDGIRGDSPLVIEDFDFHQVRTGHLRARRQAAHDRELTQAEFTEYA